ncbi:MAG: penicillin-binding protein 2 [Gammaproteobacteria bacterium]|nr:penicillin-binding protein 2 [Gammaproteobacteria bacterium]MCP5425114.1 penicillin-binding protein 2 [Gammaproteobacteria bacterium]
MPRVKNLSQERRLFSRRALLALFLVLAGLVGLVVRLAYLQIVHHDLFVTLSESNRIKLRPLPPTRGQIFDRNGVLLADNLPSYRLEITPEDVTDMDAVLAEIGARVELSESDIARFQKLRKRSPAYDSIPLRLNLKDDEVARLAVDLHRFPGVSIQADLTRHYPLGAHAVHVLGYVGRIDEKDLQRIDEQQYRGSTHIGKNGVEKSYEDTLHGKVGFQQVETNAQGRALRVLEQTPPSPGENIYLTIDSRLQAIAEQALSDYNGALVAIDPRNGEILALASMPIYDPNPFVNGIDVASYKALITSHDRPLFNRALRGVYPPGSTIKPLMGLAGLEYGVTTRGKPVYCRGFYRLPGQSHRFRDWRRGGHGTVNLDRAITESCDVYFYDLALNIGIDRIHDYLAQFDLGTLTGVDLPGEKPGLVPSQAWKEATHRKPWYAGETLIAGIGQGYMLTTPLQLAHFTATLANRGQGFKPRILYATQEQESHELHTEAPRPLPPVPVKDSRNWEAVVTAMTHVVHSGNGTARKIGIGIGYTIAGKTGTAQVFSLGQDERYNARRLAKNLHDHALFVAFAPADDPRIAVAVIAEHGGGGSATAAPIARKMLDAYMAMKP